MWWDDAVIYQVYIRSFADASGDGIGDIDGIRQRLPYLARLGIDAIWITPWFVSPMADAGYDVADFRDIASEFGTLADADRLIAAAHDHGIRVVLDIVPNHVSSEHPWFRRAVEEGVGSPLRERFHFREGRGRTGAEPPNDWTSQFGGVAWTRLSDGEWYLHQFSAEQPDLNWENPDVREDFRRTLRFWFDRGVDGLRIDVATALVKAPGLPDLGFVENAFLAEVRMDDHPYRDRDGVHEIYRDWRRIADSYAEPRMLVAEAWLERPERLQRYVRPDELHMAFNFPFLGAAWDAEALAGAIDAGLETSPPVGAVASWVLSNHDAERTVTRYGRPDTRKLRGVEPGPLSESNEELGRRRARAAATLMLALPGAVYLYQGEELGLANVDVPSDAIQDPIYVRTGGRRLGRDGCRIPLPWTAAPDGSYGFSPSGSAEPWLPQPSDWGAWAVECEVHDPGSMLRLYEDLIRHRRRLEGEITAVSAHRGVLTVERGEGFRCVRQYR